MVKTAICAALVLAGKARGRPAGNGLTVVLVNNTLVGQWMDELAKFAPSLRVARYYGTKQTITAATDVVVTTPNTKPSDAMTLRARRLIVDESHLYEPKSDPKLPTTKIHKDYSRLQFVWCVTGTPMSSSLTQLESQARMLGRTC